MSRSSRRLAFAAPFILIATLPACRHASGGGDGTTITHNPPAQRHYAEWNVFKNGDTCAADDATPDSCPPDASCNPPPPMAIACPEGITEDGSVAVFQDAEGGPCFLGSDGSEIECPSWGDGE
jgi:hypothetical protein